MSMTADSTPPHTPEPETDGAERQQSPTDLIEGLNRQISTNPSSGRLYLDRSIVFHKSSPARLRRAYSDACVAVTLGTLGGKTGRDDRVVMEAQLRRAIGLDRVGRTKDAFVLLDSAAASWKCSGPGLAKKDRMREDNEWNYFEYWLELLRDKAVKIKDGKQTATTPALSPDVTIVPGLRPVLDMFPTDADGDLDYSALAPPAPPAVSESAASPAPSVRHEWYQSTNTVTITFFAKGVDKEKARVEIGTHSLDLALPLGEAGNEFTFSFDPLAHPVDPEKSSFRISSFKVEVMLSKATVGVKWATLERAEDEISDGLAIRTAAPISTSLQSTKPSAGPVYPSSARTGPKDWDAILARPAEKKDRTGETSSKTTEQKDESKPTKPKTKNEPVVIESLDEYDSDTEAAEAADQTVDGFFKKLYAGADPDTQRAMMKSFVESNGTALSTNWAEVSKETVKTVPPEGTEAKKWDS